MEPKEIPCQVCIRTIAKKPGIKDNNFQVRVQLTILSFFLCRLKQCFCKSSIYYFETGA